MNQSYKRLSILIILAGILSLRGMEERTPETRQAEIRHIAEELFELTFIKLENLSVIENASIELRLMELQDLPVETPSNPNDNNQDAGNTHLHRAVIENWPPEAFNYLIENGANIRAVNTACQTPLALAKALERAELIKILVRAERQQSRLSELVDFAQEEASLQDQVVDANPATPLFGQDASLNSLFF